MAEIPLKPGLFVQPKSEGERPHLVGSRCRVCGYTCFPKKEVCIVCRKDGTMEEAGIGSEGTLDTFAVMQVGPPGFRVPYAIGYIRTREGAVVFAPITGVEPRDDALTIGEPMELVIEKVKEDEKGNSLVGWKYRPSRVRRG